MRTPSVKKLRTQLGLTQEAFGTLLGFSFVSVNKWENKASIPTGLSEVLLQLLESALRVSTSSKVIEELRINGTSPLQTVRTLIKLEERSQEKQ